MAEASARCARCPPWALLLLGAAFAAQLLTVGLRPVEKRAAAPLPAPPPIEALRAVALGDAPLLAAGIVLGLQSFDDQPGVAMPFRDLDYVRLAAWLERALTLDPGSDYPLLLAAQVYSQVPDAARQRLMLDLVHRAFLDAPDRRWRWLAHAAIVARHRLGDEALGLRYARDMARHARDAPGWARQMHIFLLEDLGEREQAKILLGALLASGAVTDAAEIRFLASRLEALGGAAR